MSREDMAVLRVLLERTRVLALGVVVDGAPYVGLLPFAASEDRQSLFVHASTLARHTRGLDDGAAFSALVHGDDASAPDPLQIPRVTFQGEVRRLASGSREEAAARARYTARFPDSEPTFELPDFSLYALMIRTGRFVAGFASARNISPGDLASLE